MIRKHAVVIQRWWRSLVASERTLAWICEKYRMIHLHEYMDDLSLTQRECILDGPASVAVTKRLLNRVVLVTRRRVVVPLFTCVDARHFLRIYLIVLNTNLFLPNMGTDPDERRLYNRALGVLLLWNDVMDNIQTASPVQFLHEARLFVREIAFFTKERMRRVVHQMQHTLYVECQSPTPNPVLLGWGARLVLDHGGVNALKSVQSALRIAGGLPVPR
jgi:hypothetical protein